MNPTFEERIETLIKDLIVADNKVHSRENGIAIHHLSEAKKILDVRTQDRERRGVKGKQIA